MLDPTRLRVFRAVVAAGSVQAAATNLAYTPSAVSQQLQVLQRETGLVLFEKSGRGIAPTAAALRLVASSDSVMTALSRLDTEVADLREGRTGTLSVLSVQSVGETWLPAMGGRLIAEFPEVQINLALGERPVDGSDIDLHVGTEDPDRPPQPSPGRSRHLLLTEPYAVVLPAADPLAVEPEISLAALADHPLIDEDLHETTCGQILRNAYRAAGITPRYVARVTDHHSAVAFVAAGIGAAVLPDLTLSQLPAGVVARRLVDPTPRRNIVAFVRESVEANPPVARALALLREVASAG